MDADSTDTPETPTEHGGRREGAGRPPGSRNTLPYGAVQALRAQRLRVPADATPEEAEAAGYAFARVMDVLAGKVRSDKAATVLKAAVFVREVICGPITRKVEAKVATSVAVVDPYAVPPEAPAEAPLEAPVVPDVLEDSTK